MIDASLNCAVLSVHPLDKLQSHPNFFFISSIYFYNSLTSGIFNFNPECIQIPEFVIQEAHLLRELDLNLISKNSIPILYRNETEDTWKIDLTFYEDYKLQSTNIQQN